ncbi:hypothetical protein F4802DRAFT_554303 [Xylaria palmicola]|nr:hypothetical protein F4802DRAFT_554303 [Xylaria palmicola]
MAFTINTFDDEGNSDEDILKNLRDMVERSDPRGSYYIEPTWRINGVPISECASPATSPSKRRRCQIQEPSNRPTFKQGLRQLRSSELREIIMNFCLKSLDTHRDVVQILKQMQKKHPRPISLGDRVQNPTAGLYLYCRTQKELVDIVLEMSTYDETGSFKQDVRDLVKVMKEKEGNKHYS